MERNWFVPALLILSMVMIAGCSGDGTELEGLVPVSGTVTQGGSPLEGAAVSFASTSGGRAAAGTTDADGKFTLTTLKPGDGAAPGDYQVTVTKTETVGKQYTQEEAMEYYNQHQTQPPEPEVKNVVDEKYGSKETSGLTATVPEDGVDDLTFPVD